MTGRRAVERRHKGGRRSAETSGPTASRRSVRYITAASVSAARQRDSSPPAPVRPPASCTMAGVESRVMLPARKKSQ